MTVATIKLKAGKYKIPVEIEAKNKRLYVRFPFNRTLLEDIKCMQGSKWHGFEDPPKKIWSIADSPRNRFQLNYLAGENVYEHYDKELLNITPQRDGLYNHQVDMLQFVLTRRRCLLACEMGTGKTLVAIEALEQSEYNNWYWIGPRSALAAVQLEFEKWEATKFPKFITYEYLRKLIQEDSFIPPQGIVFDESSKIKTPTAQRSQAAMIACDMMREVNPDCYIIEMSGAPAPKSPVDWWHQCEIVCPGFLREGSSDRFKKRLALIEEKESITGGVYPALITWLDDKRKCKKCGKFLDDHFVEDHTYKASINEVEALYRRMRGLVIVKFKKDCLDLPELQFKTIKVEQTDSIKRAASLITKTTARTVTALMLLRELSDGFQYKEEESGTKTCERCKGTTKVTEWFEPCDEEVPPNDETIQQEHTEAKQVTCPRCKGSGEEKAFKRVAKEVACPKEQVLIDHLDMHEPIGRAVIYAGFQASVDRCVSIAKRYQWDIIRVDGRGWEYSSSEVVMLTDKQMLERFQNPKTYTNKIVFIGQPGAAGMGITLTASQTILMYSNSFNGEDRVQVINRIHRPGMDVNRGATIIDIVHLDIDQFVLDNLQKKQDLLNLTMGELREAMV